MIDVHVHLGISQSTGKLTTEKNILDAISTYKLEMVMVMPQPTDPDRTAVHEQIYGLTQRFPTGSQASPISTPASRQLSTRSNLSIALRSSSS